MMYKGFDSDEFISWMEENFNIDSFGRSLLLNVIEYAHKHEHIGLDQFAYFLSDLLPEVDFLDVARFCDDKILTKGTIQACKRIDFYVRCFDRILTIELQDRRSREMAEYIMEKSYDIWCEQPEKVGDMCCEEFICYILESNGIEFTVIEEE